MRRLAGAATVVALLGVLAWHSVDTSVSEDDASVIRETLASVRPIPRNAPRSFAEELDAIAAVQRAVLDVAPGNVGLALDRPREPRDVFAARSGLTAAARLKRR